MAYIVWKLHIVPPVLNKMLFGRQLEHQGRHWIWWCMCGLFFTSVFCIRVDI